MLLFNVFCALHKPPRLVLTSSSFGSDIFCIIRRVLPYKVVYLKTQPSLKLIKVTVKRQFKIIIWHSYTMFTFP